MDARDRRPGRPGRDAPGGRGDRQRDGDALLLPGGLRLSAAGADPLDIGLQGQIDIGPEDLLGFDLGVLITPALAVSGRGDLRLEVTLPGGWGKVAIAFAADPAGLGLTVTPDGAAAITLLPRFDGLGALQAGAATLLPRALQAIVDELRDGGPPTGLLAAALALAEAIGIYADDAQGFEHPDRAAELARMLQPGWIESKTATAGVVADALEGIFGAPPLVDLPIGTVARAGDAIRWTYQLPVVGGEVRVTGGWTAAGAAVQAAVLIEALGLDLGPVVVESAAFGYDGDVSAGLVARLDVDGELAFLRPALRVDVTEERFALDLLPLGVAEEADLAVRIVPVPGVVATTDGALALLEQWGVPLAATVLLDAFEDRLGDQLWGGGPTSRAVLAASGLVDGETGPPVLASPLPPLPSVLLRAAQALLDGMEVRITTEPPLTLGFVTEDGRSGVRLSGRVDAGEGGTVVSVRFGDADWLDETGGVTLWLIETTTDPIPVRLAPGLGIAGVGVVLSGTEDEPLLDGAFRIGAAGGLVFLEAEFLDDARDPAVVVGDLGAGIELGDCQVVLGADEADSFLQKVLPLEMRSPFDLSVAYSRDGGLVFRGPGSGDGNGFELTFPLDLDFEVIRISELILRLGIENGTAEVEAALSGGAFVGPVAAVVERIGVIVVIREGGAELRFRPPDGVGLSLDASTIALGGFLLIDSEHGRYVGALEITVLDSFHLAAIAIITTKMPDGSDGFTLLFLISITFPVPITLGYGFFFAGAGGLLGLNRSVDLDRLRIGLRAGTADNILFPTDIVRRIDTIIRDLEETFPIDQGQFLVGPMALITWSSPPLISLKLGVILEIGSPVKVAILGVLRAALPTPDAAVVDLKVAFLGTVDIEAGLLTFDAAIYDSYIGYGDYSLSIEGDIAVRVSWGQQPDLLASVGGFHPEYSPPAFLKVPPMRRIAVSLMKDNPRISLQTYFAITSNTLQIGARLDLFFEVSGFSIAGDMGFDVLIQLSPPKFSAVVSARLAVKAGGQEILTVNLRFSLDGPAPWIAAGKASFKVLFLSVSADFRKEFGEENLTTIPGVEVLAKLLEELGKDTSWGAIEGAGNGLVTLIPPSPGAGIVVVDPGGEVRVDQRLIPLSTDFTRFGNSIALDANRVEVTELRVAGASEALDLEDLTDAFAPGAFRAMDDRDKLRAAAYEQRPSGVRATDTALRTDHVLPRPVAYDVILSDASGGDERREGPADEPRDAFERQVPGGAAGRSAGARARARRDESAAGGIDLARERFAVVGERDLAPIDDEGDAVAALPAEDGGPPSWPDGTFLLRTDAAARRAALAAGPRKGERLQVVPEAQVAT